MPRPRKINSIEITCCRCKNTFHSSLFYASTKRRSGFSARCKTCDKAVQIHTRSGITRADYDELLKAQGGRCAICLTGDTNHAYYSLFCVDHNHKTGFIRGLLCRRCNLVIGMLGDNAEFFSRASEYLGRTNLSIKYKVPEKRRHNPNSVNNYFDDTS